MNESSIDLASSSQIQHSNANNPVSGIPDSLNERDFSLRCRNCIKWRNQTKCYVLTKATHHCEKDCLVVNENEKYFLVQPLPIQHKYPKIKFCYSVEAGKQCKKLNAHEPCWFAHSDIEKNIWNSIRNLAFDYDRFVEHIKSKKRTKQLRKPRPRVEKNKINKASIKSANTPKSSKPRTTKESNDNQKPYDKIKDSVLRYYYWRLGCSKCITFSGNVEFSYVTPTRCEQNCKRNYVIARKKSFFDWFFIRKRKVHFDLPIAICYSVPSNNECTNFSKHKFCSFAHSDVEQFVWRVLENINVSFEILRNYVASESLNFGFNVDVKVMCKECYQLYETHEQDSHIDLKVCVHTNLLDDNARFFVKNNNNRYVPIREPGFSRDPSFQNINMCEDLKTKYFCSAFNETGMCPFPHSKQETEIWKAMRKHSLNSVKEYVQLWFDVNGISKKNTTHLPTSNKKTVDLNNDPCGEFFCNICSKSYPNKTKFNKHCKTTMHKRFSNLDEGRSWKFRPPYILSEISKFKICERYENGLCNLSNCGNAHGKAMLEEWIERWQFRQMKKAKLRSEAQFTYIDMILGEVKDSKSRTNVLVECLENVIIKCEQPLHFISEVKDSKHVWQFCISLKKDHQKLMQVALLFDKDRHHFSLFSKNDSISHSQVLPGQDFLNQSSNTFDVMVEFHSDISYGTYEQSVIFDFGGRPMIEKCLLVDIGQNFESVRNLRSKFTIEDYWDDTRYSVVRSVKYTSFEKGLLEKFPLKSMNEVLSVEFQEELRKQNWQYKKNIYKMFLSKLIQIEHYETKKEFSKYNLETDVTLVDSIKGHRKFRTTDVSNNISKFMIIPMNSIISEDTVEGRVINHLSYFRHIWFRLTGSNDNIYEAEIHIEEPYIDGNLVVLITTEIFDLMKNYIPESGNFEASVQFQVNGIEFARMSQKLDFVTDETLKFLFPSKLLFNVESEKIYAIADFVKLDDRQKHLIRLIMAQTMETYVSPVLVYGPFGMGKTFTLSQSIIQLIHRGNSKILVCTVSNSAADIYIKDYLSPAIRNHVISANLIRLYATERRLSNIPEVVKPYCLLAEDGLSLRLPSVEEINNCNIIVTTVTMCMHLYNRKKRLQPFTHIFIDEAAQVLEVDILGPILLANQSTRIVLAGDNVQIAPAVFSKLARSYKFNVSLLERLFDLYQKHDIVKNSTVVFTNNYRSNEFILNFLSTNFYQDVQLLSPKTIPPHPDLKYSLSFVNVNGKTKQNCQGTSFYNPKESCEVIDQIKWLRANWPNDWGELQGSICVIIPYSEQCYFIQRHLQRANIPRDICQVQTVRNVQGEEYRAVIISTVRTFESCREVYQLESQKDDFDESSLEFGFLSNRKTLNTALSRARSLIICVGDARAMIGIGDNKNIFKDFISRCINNKTVHPAITSIEDIEDLIPDDIDYV